MSDVRLLCGTHHTHVPAGVRGCTPIAGFIKSRWQRFLFCCAPIRRFLLIGAFYSVVDRVSGTQGRVAGLSKEQSKLLPSLLYVLDIRCASMHRQHMRKAPVAARTREAFPTAYCGPRQGLGGAVLADRDVSLDVEHVSLDVEHCHGAWPRPVSLSAPHRSLTRPLHNAAAYMLHVQHLPFGSRWRELTTAVCGPRRYVVGRQRLRETPGADFVPLTSPLISLSAAPPSSCVVCPASGGYLFLSFFVLECA